MHNTAARLPTAWALTALLCVILPAAVPRDACAEELGDAAVGRRLAETWCSSCHVVAPMSDHGTSNGAPTFAAIGRMKSTTYLSMRAFLRTPHSRMPDLHLGSGEIDDLTAYILSLRSR